MADVHLSLPARAESVGVVRHVLGAFGDAYELSGATLRDMRLAVTEACTNVVRHAYDAPAGGRLDVSVLSRANALAIVVEDSGCGMAGSPDTSGPGLGLPMMATLCDHLELGLTTAGTGNRVTMSFDRGVA